MVLFVLSSPVPLPLFGSPLYLHQYSQAVGLRPLPLHAVARRRAGSVLPPCGAPAKSKQTKPMGYFWCFFKFEDTELGKQFWDSNSQRSRRWWLGACAFFLSYALIKVVRLHNRGDPITSYAPLISTCATCFLLIALNIHSTGGTSTWCT